MDLKYHLLTLRESLTHLELALARAKADPDVPFWKLNDLEQQIIGMHSLFKQAAPLLPVRKCQACGKSAGDAPQWGYPEQEDPCTEHPSAWI